jgi:hypothetical protein
MGDRDVSETESSELTTASLGYAYLPRDGVADSMLRLLCSYSVGGSVTGVHTLASPEQRRVLKERRAVVQKFLVSDKKRAKSAITVMLTGFSKYHSLNHDANARAAMSKIVDKYVSELSGLPACSIEEACYLIRTGKAPGIGDYPPNTGQLYALVAQCAVTARTEANALDIVLRTDRLAYVEPSPEERSKVGARMVALAEAMKKKLGQEESGGDPVEKARALLEGIAPGALAGIPDAPRRDDRWEN